MRQLTTRLFARLRSQYQSSGCANKTTNNKSSQECADPTVVFLTHTDSPHQIHMPKLEDRLVVQPTSFADRNATILVALRKDRQTLIVRPLVTRFNADNQAMTLIVR
jgi:hypothetical protein